MGLSFLCSKSIWFLFFIILLFRNGSTELIKSLPGQPENVGFKQYSGYIVTDSSHGRALFYYFVEADSVDPLSRPLTLWFNGGPGCSSVGFGAFMEHGPFQVDKNGLLVKNEFSWNLESNMLYVESPIGVGYSYSNTSSDYIHVNDTSTAEDNLKFILNWLEEFPKYKYSDIFLTGESYAGHYVPQVVELILKYNKRHHLKPINLKGIALGNPLLDVDISIDTANFLWSHGAISDATLELKNKVCSDSRFFREFVHGNVSKECKYVFNTVRAEMGHVDTTDLLLPECLSPSLNTLQFNSGRELASLYSKLVRKGNIGDPCLEDRILTYLNNPEVQKALHANTTNLRYQWDFCSGNQYYQKDNLDMNLIPLLSDIIKEGIPLVLFSGDQDTKIPLTQTRIIANILAQDLKLIPLTKYAPWYDNKQIAGWSQSFSALKDGKNATYLTYATVRGAAHEVPFTSPSQALTLFKAFLRGSPLPRPIIKLEPFAQFHDTY